MSGKTPNHLPLAMHYVRAAIELDNGGKTKDAYASYLNSMLFIINSLHGDLSNQDFVSLCNQDTAKLLKLVEHCHERAADIISSSQKNVASNLPCTPKADTSLQTRDANSANRLSGGGSNEEINGTARSSTVDNASIDKLIMSLPTPPSRRMASARNSSARSVSSVDKIQSRQMLQAYQRRLSIQRYQPGQNLNSFRKTVEDMMLEKARRKVLNEKLEERREKLRLTAEQRFIDKTGSRATDAAQEKEIYAKVLEFEQETTWPQKLRERLAREPENIRLIEDIVITVLSAKEHPLGQQMAEMQYALYRNLSVLVANFTCPIFKLSDDDLQFKCHGPQSEMTDGGEVEWVVDGGEVGTDSLEYKHNQEAVRENDSNSESKASMNQGLEDVYLGVDLGEILDEGPDGDKCHEKGNGSATVLGLAMEGNRHNASSCHQPNGYLKHIEDGFGGDNILLVGEKSSEKENRMAEFAVPISGDLFEAAFHDFEESMLEDLVSDDFDLLPDDDVTGPGPPKGLENKAKLCPTELTAETDHLGKTVAEKDEERKQQVDKILPEKDRKIFADEDIDISHDSMVSLDKEPSDFVEGQSAGGICDAESMNLDNTVKKNTVTTQSFESPRSQISGMTAKGANDSSDEKHVEDNDDVRKVEPAEVKESHNEEDYVYEDDDSNECFDTESTDEDDHYVKDNSDKSNCKNITCRTDVGNLGRDMQNEEKDKKVLEFMGCQCLENCTCGNGASSENARADEIEDSEHKETLAFKVNGADGEVKLAFDNQHVKESVLKDNGEDSGDEDVGDEDFGDEDFGAEDFGDEDFGAVDLKGGRASETKLEEGESTVSDKSKASNDVGVFNESSVKDRVGADAAQQDTSSAKHNDNETRRILQQHPQNAVDEEEFSSYENNLDDLELRNGVNKAVKEIHASLSKLHSLLIITYDALDLPIGRDQSYAVVESLFFKPLWQWVNLAFRRLNVKKEIKLYKIIKQRRCCNPAEFFIREKYVLPDSLDDVRNYPYKKAVDQLRKITSYSSPLDKLECIVLTTKLICQCVTEYWLARGDSQPPSVGCDDLLPILTYVIVKAALPQLVSECQAMEEFIHESYLLGEEGYCLTTLSTAIAYSTSLRSKDNLGHHV